MEGHNKHFSHTHNLNLHQMPEGTKITCSGCNSTGTATIYACWQCNFFLHEQCYRVSRSLLHPSHPSHPLTLVPYPTYPSNSFYCNSCNQIGTGFSFSCGDCEFDLHVQCAYNISKSAFLTPQTHVDPHQDFSHPTQTPSFTPNHAFPNQSLKHETLPNFNAQHAYMPHQTVTTTPNDPSISNPPSNQTPIFNPQNAYMPHQTPTLHSIPNPSPNQETAPSFNPQHASMPNQTPTHQHIPNNPIPNYHPISGPIPRFNAPQTIPNNHLPTNYPPVNETMPSFNAPQNSHIPQPIPSNPIPNYPPINQAAPSFNAPQNSHIPQAVTQEPINPNVPMPNFPSKAETFQNTNASTESTPKADQPIQVKTRGIMHFSHPHAIRLVNLKDGKDSVACSACEETISDSGYSCPISSCSFHLDKSCFKLAQEIQHKSHPEHPLTLLPFSSDEYGKFICSACFTDCLGFTYHCASCEFNLHVKCASSPETVKRKDHEHPLNLVYSCPIKGEEYTFFCDVCGGVVQENCWTYYCEKCDYGTHVDCVNCEDSPVEETPAEESSSSTGDPVLDAQLQMQRLQLQMEMARQSAQMMISMGQSLSNLAG